MGGRLKRAGMYVYRWLAQNAVQPKLTHKKCKKAQWLSGEALQIAVKKREANGKEKRKDIPM